MSAEPTPRSEERSYRWAILAVGMGAQGALSALQQGLPSLGPALRQELGLSLSQVGVVLASVSWGIVLMLLPWGWLADHVGDRLVITLGLAGSSGALVGASSMDHMWSLMAGLAAAGALGGSASIAGGSAVMRWFGRHERGLAFGVRQMAVPLGGAAAAVSLPLLVQMGGLRAALLALAATAAAAALAAAIWMREPAPAPARLVPPDRQPPLRDRRIWRLSAGSALVVCAQFAILTFVVLFLHDHRGVAVGTAAGALATIQLGGAISRLVVGRRSDRTGRRIVPLRWLSLSSAAAVASTAVLTNAPLVLLVPVLLVAGILATSWNGLAFTAIAEIAGRDRAATAIGLQQSVMRTLSTTVGVGFGVLVAATSWSAGFALLSVLSLAGWWVMRSLLAEEEDRILAREHCLRAVG